MTLHRITYGEKILCSECYRSNLQLGNIHIIHIPFACLICETKQTSNTREVCRECLHKIWKQHTIDMHNSVDIS